MEHMVNDSTEKQMQQGSSSVVHSKEEEDEEEDNKPEDADHSLAATLASIESVKVCKYSFS